MKKTAILFAGQSSQYPKMGKELLDIFPQFSYIYTLGSEILGFDLKEACFEADDETLKQTEIAQPAIFATSILSYEAVKTLGIIPDMVAGHSLGEYAAMVASDMITLENGFKLIKKRASAMAKCAALQRSAMCAVIGVDAQEIAKICESIDGYVVPVNYNSTQQTVIAGEEQAIATAMEIFAKMGKRTVKLAVSAAFHSKLMQPAADEFSENIKEFKFNPPKIDFYSNLTGEKLADFGDMASYLCKHIVSPVLFTNELKSMQNAGANYFVECGPNKVLTGLVRKTLQDITANNAEDAKSLEKLRLQLEL